MDNIRVGKSGVPNGGRGVFAAQDIAQDEVIERCPAVVCKKEDKEFLRHTDLLYYYFRWDVAEDNHQAAIALGYGSLYNHSYTPNVLYKKIFTESTIEFVALRDIKSGEELFVNYNGDPKDQSPVWVTSTPPATPKS